ncbi:MAG: heme-copper oxidase subunit III [Verrucomicrobiales bacterium]|nr:heme-copper oxidase subunit III [Verrucomicrobiales bacterium]
MDIPYTVLPRRDTGLYNAKLGIWLFLASEVMLFGALFSAYILLRVGSYPGVWPHGILNVPVGTLNTMVLICSSVTVVLAWAALKANDFAKYRKIQLVTVLCALAFVCIKSYEYYDKFTHYEVVMKDGRVIDGHLVRKEGGGQVVNGRKQPPEFIVLHGVEFPAEMKAAGMAKIPLLEAIEKKSGHHAEHKEFRVAWSDTTRVQNYGPWHNTYLAIYFTLTALHALHVIGGAAVIFWIWGPGAAMWKTDPERYTNRVEVSGLFWHFVDLVWIFLFPILYLL